MDELIFFCIALPLALMLAVSEVAAAFHDKPHAVRAVFHAWALPFYVLYVLLTFLIGKVLIEQIHLPLSWTSAIALGLLGPALFKTQTKLFRPISGGKGELNANVERIISSVQQFCFNQIETGLSRHRVNLIRQAASKDEAQLLDLLQTVAGTEEFTANLKPLIDERRALEPDSLKLFLAELILRQDASALNQSL